ncbi:hypothetical protein HYH03_005799 [Edaphochlamys debaryana]|uniref:PARP-type domain-containing protein n=1 Tax=Edaphochlamys debaryana TaxID=47281 RepID=A0A835Y4Y3_9CHLO|nr:hypothetical protein HYH03_005799 [Edaphochlamys debaryana]|eukprot:KAG2496200.1 hypothetical protein HYH03_005799 [Edaphochlamys debaryana]
MPTVYSVEYDPSGRATCKNTKCGTKIEKNTMRFASVSESDDGKRFTNNYHIGCVSDKILANALAAHGNHEALVTKLKPEDQEVAIAVLKKEREAPPPPAESPAPKKATPRKRAAGDDEEGSPAAKPARGGAKRKPAKVEYSDDAFSGDDDDVLGDGEDPSDEDYEAKPKKAKKGAAAAKGGAKGKAAPKGRGKKKAASDDEDSDDY